ncbi:hypothetical protein [Geochorda subterranea]|uniref:Uncharacterized protein n=1 Tax=Geochorda subterranea TaxID=3109564 RepID=A0ABZ1BM18_9FIRM|nr:hypothetical protein [Limnochorda sp. LNt]WRP13855.1 hypothetical protein VLY81_10465 [Limnochorda sp. LNt]
MKRLGWLLVLAALLLSGGMALAASNGYPLPPGASETKVWELQGSTWVGLTFGDPNGPARSWNSGPYNQGITNQAVTGFQFTNHASVAQWVEYTMSGTRKDWRIRRPGIYASDSMTGTIKSNNDVVISFSGFGPLAYEAPGQGVDEYIETEYGYSTVEDPNLVVWVPAEDLNETSILLEDSEALHYGQQWKLWSKINVGPSNSSSEYENVGTVTVTLTNIKLWIDPATGFYADLVGPR